MGIRFEGIMTGFNLTQAHIDERLSLYEITDYLKQGLILADKGLIGDSFQSEFRLATPFKHSLGKT